MTRTMKVAHKGETKKRVVEVGVIDLPKITRDGAMLNRRVDEILDSRERLVRRRVAASMSPKAQADRPAARQELERRQRCQTMRAFRQRAYDDGVLAKVGPAVLEPLTERPLLRGRVGRNGRLIRKPAAQPVQMRRAA